MKPYKPTLIVLVSVALSTAPVPVHVALKAGLSFFIGTSAYAKNGNGGGNRGGPSDKTGADNKDGKGRNGSHAKAQGRAASVARKDVTPDSLAIRYRNGYFEQVVKGRFIMKDSKGRTIVNRKATAKDRIRLWFKRITP
jgi:hypothetical protein